MKTVILLWYTYVIYVFTCHLWMFFFLLIILYFKSKPSALSYSTIHIVDLERVENCISLHLTFNHY